MSNPQTENGYFKFANELYDAIAVYGFKKSHRAILDAVIRKTYGYGKKSDDISLTQIEIMTRLDYSNCGKAIKELVSLNVIIKNEGKYGQNLGLNKRYRTWAGWDASWEYWNKNGEEQPTEQPAKKPEPDLTAEQIECWEWAKLQDWWMNNAPVTVETKKGYLHNEVTLKKQYKAFKSKPEKRMTRLEEKNNRGKTIKRKSFLTMGQNNEKIIEGEVIND